MTALEDARAALAYPVRPGHLYQPLTIVVEALRALIAEHECLTAEMHQRELHHFETEQMLVQAGIDPDAAPPTDDEREALADIWAVEHGGSAAPDRHVRVGYPLADAILAAGFHRQGPITDEWEYGSKHPDMDMEPCPWSRNFLNNLVKNQGHEMYRRRRSVPAGPWEPVEAARDAS